MAKPVILQQSISPALRSARNLAWCALIVLGIAGRALAEDGSGFRIVEKKDASGVTLFAESDYNTEFTVTLTADLTNMTASRPLPLTLDSGGKKSVELVRFQKTNPRQPWTYTYTDHFKRGTQRKSQSNDYVYLLPFSPNTSHKLMQGNFGKFSHYEGSQEEYAVDFQADIGTIICAARAGVVTGVRQDSTVNGTDPAYKLLANYIIIKHTDGTFAEYLHIQPLGALVKLGQQVAAGQPIAKSGNIGYTTGPHIHFAVLQTVDGNTRITLPTRFQTSDGVLNTLKEGVIYTNAATTKSPPLPPSKATSSVPSPPLSTPTPRAAK